MRLAVNGWLLLGPRTGIHRYLVNILTRCTSELVSDRFERVTVYVHRSLDRGEVPLPSGVAERVLGPAAPMVVWENLRFGPVADEDVALCPSYTRPARAQGATVVVVHDVTFVAHPELYPRAQPLYSRLFHWSARHATLVLTSTEAAARDITGCWDVPPSRLRVVPLAAADAFHPVEDGRADDVRRRVVGSLDPYFLFVGKTSGRRRVPLLLEALAAFRKDTGLNHHVVLTGPPPTFELDDVVASLGLTGQVHHAGFVPDSDLNLLYNAAEAVVCPSVHETVSLPILEAQASGAPVICLDTPGPRELTGGAAWFLPELGREELVEAMTSLAGNPSRRGELADAGVAHARQFSWTRTASETLDVLAEAASL